MKFFKYLNGKISLLKNKINQRLGICFIKIKIIIIISIQEFFFNTNSRVEEYFWHTFYFSFLIIFL